MEHLPAQWPGERCAGVGAAVGGAGDSAASFLRPWCWVLGGTGWASALSQAAGEGWRELARSQAEKG